jgi:hypothetical protein
MTSVTGQLTLEAGILDNVIAASLQGRRLRPLVSLTFNAVLMIEETL